jgi:glycolate oxidase
MDPELKGLDVSDTPEDLACYGFDASGLEGGPALVAWPQSTDDIVQLVLYAAKKNIAIVPRGAGTGMTAGSVPTRGAMVLSFEKLADIIEVDTENQHVLVEPGLINGHLQAALDPKGYFYPPDPASMNFCTLGGNVAENAGGPRALKYGVTRDYVMQLEAVVPSGDIIMTGVRTHKGVVGYDLTRLLVGSEGTLAVISKILLKILPQTEAVTTLLAFFDDIESAGRAVSGIIASRIIPRTLEIMDRGAIEAVNSFAPTGLPEEVEALLLIELDGHPRAIEEEGERVVEACSAQGGRVEMAGDDESRERLWAARRGVSPALHHTGMKKINEDIVVPRSQMAPMLGFLAELSQKTGIKIVNFGHAGDGNIHVNVMVPPDDDDLLRQAHDVVREMFRKVIELGGTISGEHGVGMTKAEYIEMEIHPRELGLMRDIKKLFDPQGIMNPGKIFPKARSPYETTMPGLKHKGI